MNISNWWFMFFFLESEHWFKCITSTFCEIVKRYHESCYRDAVLMLLTFLWLCQWILSYSRGINMVKHKNFVMVPKTYKNKNVESYIWFSKCNKISFVPSLDDKNELNLRKTFFNQNCVILVSMLLSKLGRGLFSVNYSIFATSI